MKISIRQLLREPAQERRRRKRRYSQSRRGYPHVAYTLFCPTLAPPDKSGEHQNGERCTEHLDAQGIGCNPGNVRQLMVVIVSGHPEGCAARCLRYPTTQRKKRKFSAHGILVPP